MSINGDIDNSLYEVDFNVNCVQETTIYVKPGVYALSERKLKSLIRIAQLQKYYQCNPVRFISDFFGVELLDAQTWVVQGAWNCPNVLFVCTRGFGKSTTIDLFTMAKDMLFSNYWTYIASGSGSQAEETFTTLEKLANDNIDTMVGSTGYIFKQEIEIKNAAGDGFSHSSNGFTYSLYNGSMTQTLNSNIDRKRGKRGNVIFDECGFLNAEMMNVYGAFAIVNKSFRTGKDRDGNILDVNRIRSIPSEIPNQKFYISSASSTDTEFYKLYRDFSKKMLMGDPNYFVAHIDCEVAFSPTLHGEIIPPLLSKDTVEAAMRANPEKARREYYCQFTTDAGENAIIKRGAIARNEEIRKPLLYNDTGDKKFIITYDPARIKDQSCVLIGELYEDKDPSGLLNFNVRLVNCIPLIDVEKRDKTPMTIPNQVKEIRKIILDYNQGGDEFYSNIVGIYIDAGAAGNASAITDLLMQDWTDDAGIIHKGIIDKEYSKDYIKKFPNAVDKLHMMQPSAFKSEMYEALIRMVDENHIKFTANYDSKGYLTVVDIDKKKMESERKRIVEKLKKQKIPEGQIEELIEKELLNVQNASTKNIKLNIQEEAALGAIDALKEQLVNMCRIKRDSGKDGFELVPEKRNTMHDDMAYTTALMGYALNQERKKRIMRNARKPMSNIAAKLASQARTSRKGYSMFG